MTSRRVQIYMDSDYRGEDNCEDYPFWQLPHDEWGFNRLEATLKDDEVWYKGSPVCQFSEFIEHAHSEGELRYTLFLTSEEAEAPGISYWYREPLIFDGLPITQTHISLYIEF